MIWDLTRSSAGNYYDFTSYRVWFSFFFFKSKLSLLKSPCRKYFSHHCESPLKLKGTYFKTLNLTVRGSHISFCILYPGVLIPLCYNNQFDFNAWKGTPSLKYSRNLLALKRKLQVGRNEGVNKKNLIGIHSKYKSPQGRYKN